MMSLTQFFSAFYFLWPALLILAPMPWIIRRFFIPVAKEQRPLIAPNFAQRLRRFVSPNVTLAHHESPPHSNQRLQHLMFGLIWLLLIIAAMRPVWYITPAPFETSGRDMMLSIDISPTMLREDMLWQGQRIDRLTALKRVIENFILERQGDRMGLIVFSTEAHLVSPLTYDLRAINQLMLESEVGMAGNTTAIGDSIGLAIKHLSRQENDRAVLVLLTDGANNDGFLDPIEAGEKAAEMGLIIHTIGFGNISGTRGRTINSAFDIDTASLNTLADMTGGRNFAAEDTQSLQVVYQAINDIEANRFELNHYRARYELFIWPLGLALILSWCWAAYRLVGSGVKHV